MASSPSDPFNADLIRELGGIGQPCPLPYGDAVFMGVWEGGEGGEGAGGAEAPDRHG